MHTAELSAIVWAETRELGPAPADGSGPINTARRLIARLVASTSGAGFLQRAALPPTDDPLLGTAAEALGKIAEEAMTAPADDPRLLIWESADGHQPSQSPKPPAPWDSLAVDQLTHHDEYHVGDRTLHLFSRASSTDLVNAPVFVSALTGTGTKTVRLGMANPSRSMAQPKRGYWLSIAALVLFSLACLWAYNLGAAARATVQRFEQVAVLEDRFIEPQPASTEPSDTRRLCRVETPPSDLVLGPEDWRVRLADRERRDVDPQTGQAHVTRLNLAEGDHCYAHWARSQQSLANDPSVSWWTRTAVALTGSGAGPVSGLYPLLLALASLAILFVAAGYGIVGRPMGVVIDERNRMSLTLAQLALWSVVLIGGLATLALYNFGFGGSTFAALDQLAILEAQGLEAVGQARPGPWERIVAGYHLIPSMPWALWGVLGLAAATPIANRLISPASFQTPQSWIDEAKNASPVVLERRASPFDAKLGDLAVKEIAGQADLIDVTRLQHVAFTGLLVISYLFLLFDTVTGIDPLRIVRSYAEHTTVFVSMPPVDPTFLALLFVTHAALLGGKYFERQPGAPGQ